MTRQEFEAQWRRIKYGMMYLDKTVDRQEMREVWYRELEKYECRFLECTIDSLMEDGLTYHPSLSLVKMMCRNERDRFMRRANLERTRNCKKCKGLGFVKEIRKGIEFARDCSCRFTLPEVARAQNVTSRNASHPPR